MPRGKRKWWFLGLAALLVLLIGALLALNAPEPPVPDFLSGAQPNGYDLYLQAGNALQGQSPTELVLNSRAVLDEDVGALRLFLEQNDEALRLWREALPLETEASAAWYDPPHLPMGQLGKFKKLAQAGQVAALYAEAQGDLDQATQIYLDTIRMGQGIEHGPAICLLVGIAIESMGLSNLQKLAPRLSDPQKAKLAEELYALNGARIPFDEVLRRETYFAQQSAPTVLHQLVFRFHPSVKKSRATIQAKYDTFEQTMAQVAQALADPQ